MRVISDLTTNHTGDKHEWFVARRRELYLFDESGDYEAWWGIKSLPKLNWLSPVLRKRIQETAHRWLQPPHSLDGWRVDVANMSGRTGETDVNAEVAPTLRQVLNEDSLLVAENFHDFRPDFRGWHGVMNYAGFSRPVWTWLRGNLEIPYFEMPVAMPRVGGAAAAATMRAFRAGVPWEFVLHSWAILDSHDSPRFRTIAGSRDRQLVGIGLQMTMPGVPMVFAGDELGLEGEWGEDARRTMPWDRSDAWDTALLDEYRRLIGLRRSRPRSLAVESASPSWTTTSLSTCERRAANASSSRQPGRARPGAAAALRTGSTRAGEFVRIGGNIESDDAVLPAVDDPHSTSGG